MRVTGANAFAAIMLLGSSLAAQAQDFDPFDPLRALLPHPSTRAAATLQRRAPRPAQATTSQLWATYYGGEMGRHAHTASGEIFNPGGYTAAHRSLPFGTRLQVTNPANGRQIEVRINDRGPFRRGYSLDLAAGAARALGFISGPLHTRVIR